MSSLVVQFSVLAAEAHEPVDQVLAWGIGAGTLGLFLALIGALVAFGGGREHS
ncbi:MAG: hypothetical protein ACXWXO_20720 [Nocardioides sp.]